MKKIVLFLLASFIYLAGLADVRLPKLLSDNMVLQRNKPLTLWGWADPNEKVSVQFNKQTKGGKTDEAGKWSIILVAESAGGPFQLIVKGKNTITLANILVGDVWVCSGQSNMEWPLRSATNANLEIQQANFPEIRHFTVQKDLSSKPEEDVKGGDWKICSPETAGDFTAVGYFFAREVYQKTKIPIGLIHTSWGGTHSETWTSREAFERHAEFKDMIATMPVANLDVLEKRIKEKFEKKLRDQNIVPVVTGEVEKWRDSAFNDSHWPVLNLPNGLPTSNFQGLAWFRKTVYIEKTEASEVAELHLGMIDYSDETFVNSIRVGTTQNKPSEFRKYRIPAGVLKEGKNVISVRVGCGSGILGRENGNDLKLVFNNSEISLSGVWVFNVERNESVLSATPNSYPTLLFNAMINPLLNLGIAGALWYQGESNAWRAYQYRVAFPLMIQDWRNHWKQGDFPFYFVQLASFNSGNGNSTRGSSWAELREAQTLTLSLPNTGMVTTTDIGDANDIHPRNKQDVGKRLAAIALNNVYGQSMVFSGPVYKSIKVEGDKVRISFSSVGSGLFVKDKYGYLKGFEVAGTDQKFSYAQAWLEGNEVVVSAQNVTSPVAVRFAWADNPEDANLFNKEGFPAVPFRSDTWKGITENGKFKIE